MDEKCEMKGVQLTCPVCKKAFPVRVISLQGKVDISVRCPHCKKISKIAMQDINL